MTKQLNIAEIRLDMNQPRMLTVQLADELRRLIARDFLDGAVLPSARQLANSLKINRLTVGRAYAELERQGLVQSERTSGRFVSIDDEKIEELRKDLSDFYIKELFRRLRDLGMDDEKIRDVLSKWRDE